jgi:DMSO/TMAO reductase YedYZ molybdopterin-dependent catalytic subunit
MSRLFGDDDYAQGGGICRGKAGLKRKTSSVPLIPRGFVRRIPLAPHQLTDPITPQRDLFVLAHLSVPIVDLGSWRLTIGGLVDRPSIVDFEESGGSPPDDSAPSNAKPMPS